MWAIRVRARVTAIDRVGVRVKVRLGLGHIGLDLGLEEGYRVGIHRS